MRFKEHRKNWLIKTSTPLRFSLFQQFCDAPRIAKAPWKDLWPLRRPWHLTTPLDKPMLPFPSSGLMYLLLGAFSQPSYKFWLMKSTYGLNVNLIFQAALRIFILLLYLWFTPWEFDLFAVTCVKSRFYLKLTVLCWFKPDCQLKDVTQIYL